MKAVVLREQTPGEKRVALVPDAVGKLGKLGVQVTVEKGAGLAAGFRDADYEAQGAQLADSAEAALRGAEALVKFHRPSEAELSALPDGALILSFLRADDAYLQLLEKKKLTVLAMEKVPRTTRGQAVDALSSQATVAGYRAVLLGAEASPRLFPMLTTAAGTLTPSKVLVLGAGVAGLQAIATARRLGAVVTAFDVRAAAREQVLSLGAKFVDAEVVGKEGEGQGGYAKEVGEAQQARILEVVGNAIREMDVVVSTAQIPNRPAPRLVTSHMLETMKEGAVIVDLAAETGGNVEGTKPGETVRVGGVTLMGPLLVPAGFPFHASQMYSRNIQNLLALLVKDGKRAVNLSDELIAAMTVTHEGQRR